MMYTSLADAAVESMLRTIQEDILGAMLRVNSLLQLQKQYCKLIGCTLQGNGSDSINDKGGCWTLSSDPIKVMERGLRTMRLLHALQITRDYICRQF